MLITSKRGARDNVVTYEHFCDTTADLDKIPKEQITLGSTAVVLKDEDDGLSVYIANSNKEWISFSNTGTGGGSMATLASLLDMNISNPANGQTLVYNGETEKWENGEDKVILEITATYDEDTDSYNYTTDKTYNEIISMLNNNIKTIMLYLIDEEERYVNSFFTFSHIDGAGRIYFYRVFTPRASDGQPDLFISTICIDSQMDSGDEIPLISYNNWSFDARSTD